MTIKINIFLISIVMSLCYVFYIINTSSSAPLTESSNSNKHFELSSFEVSYEKLKRENKTIQAYLNKKTTISKPKTTYLKDNLHSKHLSKQKANHLQNRFLDLVTSYENCAIAPSNCSTKALNSLELGFNSLMKIQETFGLEHKSSLYNKLYKLSITNHKIAKWSINLASREKSSSSLKGFFAMKLLPPQSQTHLYLTALDSQHLQVIRLAKKALKNAITTGSLGEVLSISNKYNLFLDYFNKDEQNFIFKSICRFSKKLGFELIKTNLIKSTQITHYCES